MASPIPGGLENQAREPLDGKYWVDTEGNLETGLVFNGLHRWTKDTGKEYVRRNGVWILELEYHPIQSSEVIADSQGIVGLNLDEAIRWLANNRSGNTTTPAPTLTSISISGANSINEGSSSTYTVIGTYSDGSTRQITSGITWSQNAPNGVVTIPTNTTQGDDRNITISATVESKTNSKTILVYDTTTGTTPSPVLNSITINGPSSINEGSSANYTITATYSDNSTQTINNSSITWSNNAPNGVVTIASNQTQNDSTTLTINATYNSKNTSRTITINDTTQTPVSYGYTLPLANGTQTADGMSFVSPSSETLNFDLINDTSGPTISIAITSNGATSYIDYASEYAGKPYIFKNNQGTKFNNTFPSADNLNIIY